MFFRHNNYMSKIFLWFEIVLLQGNALPNGCDVSSSTSLTVLDCSNMKLTGRELPLQSKIPSATQLVVLNLVNCTGKIDQTSFSGIKHLQSINLDSCSMDQLTLPILSELKDLDIRNSLTPRISRDSFKNAKHLKRIALSGNKMEIASGSFQDLSFLTSLDIEHQNVTLHEHFLKGLKSLLLLSLSDTTIQKISRNIFKEVPDLLDLNLSGNPITVFETGALDPIKKLKDLNIQETLLETLDTELFRELKNLETLKMTADALANFKLEKFLEYCPKFSNFDFSISDCGKPEVKKLQEKTARMNAFIYVYFDGFDRPDRC